MTWKVLLNRLQQLSPTELKQTATVHTQVLDEFYPVTEMRASTIGDVADGVLDYGHFYLETDE
ncbi:hypothetical protein LCGC14_1833350 [marine sediment metagenome]|uniref:Uncharacterized protein n=1 Tax=marine sediment metagenome TaxID=412755 RepID=A0A0F9JEW0_9ZZZZ